VSLAVSFDGTVTETKTLTVVQKTTDKQDWPAYDRAQAREKDRIQELLFDLCRNLTELENTARGRRPHTVKDTVFSMVSRRISPSIPVGPVAASSTAGMTKSTA